VAFGWIGRAPMSMLPIALVIAVEKLTGSYGLGGAAAGAYTLANAAAGPWLGRRVDRLGQRRVGRVLVAGFVVAGAGLVSLFALAGPAVLVLPLAAVAGAVQPSLGAWTRTRWTVLLEGVRERETAQAVESISDELNCLVGPSAVSILAAAGAPWLPITVAVLLGSVGTAAVLALRRSEPQPAAHGGPSPQGDQAPARSTATVAVPSASAAIHAEPDFRVFLLELLLLGVALGGMTVVLVSGSGALGDAGYTALVFAVNSAASLIAGILIGRVAFQGPARTRFARALIVYSFGLLPILLLSGQSGFLFAAFVAGASIAPTFIQANAHVASVVEPARRTEAFAWIGSAVVLGIAAGSAVLGRIVDAGGVEAARLSIVVIGFLPGTFGLAWSNLGRR